MEQQANWKKRTVLFLVSQGVTLFGSSLVQFAMVWYVTLETSSGAWVSALTVCAFVPQMLISFVSGVWADRWNKKLLIILSDAAIALATLALVLLMPAIGGEERLLYALLAVSVLRSLGTGVQLPAVNAMIPALVPAEHLMRFNGVNAALQSAVQFAAPAAAGAVLTFGALPSALLIDVFTAAVGIGLLACVALPKTVVAAPTERVSVLADMRLGMRYAFSDGFLKRLLPLYGAFIFLCVPSGFLATLFVSRTYGDAYWYLTAVELVGFLGMAGGGALLGAWGGFKNRMATLLVGLAAFGVLTVAMGAIHNFPLYLGLMVVMGVGLTMAQTATTTLVQEKARPDMQGRVFGFLNVMYSGFLPLGMAVFGPLADVVPLSALMIAAGLLLLLLAVFCRMQRNFYETGRPAETEES